MAAKTSKTFVLKHGQDLLPGGGGGRGGGRGELLSFVAGDNQGDQGSQVAGNEDRSGSTTLAMTPETIKSICIRLSWLGSFLALWLWCSFLDAKYTPRDPDFRLSWNLIGAYQWCMVAYLSNLILTFLKVIFETDLKKLNLHLVSCYINVIAAGSYAMLWTGFSPVVPDIGSCLYIPQRWLMYIFTVPAIFHIMGQISDYTPAKKLQVDLMNVAIMVFGGIGSMPWLPVVHKVLVSLVAMGIFPFVLVHMWNMTSSAVSECSDGKTSKAGIRFVRAFTIGLYNCFPIMYYGAFLGLADVEVLEPAWAALDWMIKMVYSSSLMETNFFVAQRREMILRAVEESNKIQTIKQLSSAIERKDDFLSTMSHELRTPLNGIIGLSESLELGSAGELPKAAVQVISTVKHSGRRLLQLINDILDAAKMKQGMLIIKHEEVDIKSLVQDVVEICTTLVRKDVKLINTVGNVPNIVGDTGRIVQILYNLVGNAAKFTKTGCIIVGSSVSEKGDRVSLSVTDTGCGVPQNKISTIFGAFEQADMSTTRRYGGTGLGLHLVKELVKAHNGDIEVESALGKGSKFVVWLPVNQERTGPTEDSPSGDHALPDPDDRRHSEPFEDDAQHSNFQPSPSPSTRPLDRSYHDKPYHAELHGGRHMILSVDDDPINQMVVDNLLTPEGYKVERAMDGMEALKFLERSEVLPDLILLDVMMPVMDGYKVCKEVRKNNPTIPIIMVSAKGRPDDVLNGLEAGSNDYVKKPFHLQELLTRIRIHIKNRELVVVQGTKNATSGINLEALIDTL